MIGRKALTGLSLLCALVFCAFAAPSAFAATSGTTAFTCVEVANTGGFNDAHCTSVNASHTGKFTHAKITTKTTITGTNAGTKNETKEATNAVLVTTAGGLETEIVATSVSSTGSLENSLNGEVHTITGKGIFVEYKGLTVSKPAGQECKVKGGVIKTNELESMDVEMTQVFTPVNAAKEFVKITFEGCKTAGLNKEYVVTGTAAATPTGATLVFNIPKVGSTLEFGGQKASLNQTETLKNSTSGTGIAATTTPFSE